jgi:putative methionine-R-sulfoxide reductase with GAF domain
VRASNGNIIGVLRVRYDAEVIQPLVKTSVDSFAHAGTFAVLFDENYVRLMDTSDAGLLFKSVVPLPADKLAELQAGTDPRLPAGTAAELSTNLQDLQKSLENLDAQSIFSANFAASGQSLDQAVGTRLKNQPWTIVFVQPQANFLAPIQAGTRNSLVIAIIVAALVTFVAFFISRLISRPIVQLTNIAQQIAGGDMNVQAPVTSTDEIGTLATTFNDMTGRLGQAFEDVRRQALAVQTSAEVSRRLSTATSPNQLAADVVEQVQEAFKYYHAHIYFLDEATGNLVMAGGTGEAGATMLARGHKIPKGRGLVGRAADTNGPVLVPDVSQAEGWLPNPLLPDTKSEVAIPISAGRQVLGVLDVQQNVVNGLGEEDVSLLQSLAGQVAISLQNARSYEQAKSQADLESLVNDIGQKIQRATTVEDTLQTAIREIGLALGASRVSANIGTNRQNDGFEINQN